MKVLTLILQLLPVIKELMKLAEDMLGNGTGPDKKKFVIDTAEKIVDNPDNWAIIGNALSTLINVLAAFMFPKG